MVPDMDDATLSRTGADTNTFYAYTIDAPRTADTPAIGLCLARSEGVGRRLAVHLVLLQLALSEERLPFFLHDVVDLRRLMTAAKHGLGDLLWGGAVLGHAIEGIERVSTAHPARAIRAIRAAWAIVVAPYHDSAARPHARLWLAPERANELLQQHHEATTVIERSFFTTAFPASRARTAPLPHISFVSPHDPDRCA